ncbi:MAG TPA: ABC transporter substrate-binding protein [Gemmatimonadaceae bacterium]|nr:ABC transporter substrate-binding protein [Gemmatimonadaceae bacterium]
MKRLVLLMVLLASCSRRSDSALAFGAAGPWKEEYGAFNRMGIELARDEINVRPERAGAPLRIDFEDDEGSGQAASRIAQKFVDSRDIVAVVGHVNSGAMVAAAQVYDGHLAAVATTATSPALTGISRWAFRVISSDSANGDDIAKFAHRLGRARAAILYENNTYGRGLADAFRRGFAGQVVSMDPIGEEKEQSFDAYVAYFKQSKPDVVFVAGTDASGLAFLREARRQQLDADLMGGDGWSGLRSDTLRSQGVFVGVPFTAEDPRPEAQRFVAAFSARFHVRPDNNAALAYDATILLYDAAMKAGGDRARIRDYLASLNASTAFRGVTGTIFFRPDGDPVGNSVVMTRIDHGVLRVAQAGS